MVAAPLFTDIVRALSNKATDSHACFVQHLARCGTIYEHLNVQRRGLQLGRQKLFNLQWGYGQIGSLEQRTITIQQIFRLGVVRCCCSGSGQLVGRNEPGVVHHKLWSGGLRCSCSPNGRCLRVRPAVSSSNNHPMARG